MPAKGHRTLDRKEDVLSFRATQQEAVLVAEQAALLNMTRSDYLRSVFAGLFQSKEMRNLG